MSRYSSDGVATRSQNERAPTRAVGRLPTRQARPGYTTLAVGLMLGAGLFGAWSYGRAGEKTPLVVVVRDVPAGHAITRDDLSTVQVAGGVTAIAGTSVEGVVGKTAAVPLLKNMLLQRSMISDAPELSPNQAQIGVVVTSGQIPADSLAPGDMVQVLQLPAKTSTIAGTVGRARVLVDSVPVYSAKADSSQGGATLVTLVVPLSVAPNIAAASGAGLVAMVRVAS